MRISIGTSCVNSASSIADYRTARQRVVVREFCICSMAASIYSASLNPSASTHAGRGFDVVASRSSNTLNPFTA
jgi:hypothetical protein